MSQSNHPEQAGSINTSVNGIGNAVGPGAQAIVNQTLLPPLPVNLRSLVQALIEHYGQDIFGGRDAELAILDAFLDNPECPYGLLVALTGRGKTALLIRWLARIQQQQPKWQIIFAPVSIRFETASEEVILGILAHSLAEIHQDLEQFRQYDKTPKSLRALVSDYLRRPLPDDTQLLLVLDGIDEAIGWEIGTLCAIAPQVGLKIVVAARQRADMLRENWQHHLGWDNYPVTQLDLNQLDRSAVEALLTQSIPTNASDSSFVNQFWRVTKGDPLTCNLLLKALTSGKIKPDSLTHRPPGLEAFLKDWVETLRKRRKASTAVRELLALCAAAYGPLTSDDLQTLAPDVFHEQADIGDAVNEDEIARFIITVGEHTYVFSHQRLREVFLEQIYPPKDREKLQQRLIDYGAAWYVGRSQPLPDYLRQFWIAHLRAKGDWRRIQQVLTEIVPTPDGEHHQQPWQVARFAAEGSDTAYLADLDLLWTWTEEQNDLALMFRCALINASLRSRSANLFPELLVQLVQIGTPDGVWSPAAALEQIIHMPDPHNQARCLQALTEAGISLPWQRALDIVRSISHEQSRAQALSALAPLLPVQLLADALLAVQNISDEYYRVQALSALAPLLSPHQQQAVLAQALNTALNISDKWNRAQALIALAPLLSPHQQQAVLAQALQAALTISDDDERAQALIALAPHLPAQLLPEALQAALTISDDDERAQALIALAPLLPPDQQQALLAQALLAAQNISDQSSRAQALIALAPLLPPDQQQTLLAQALLAAQNISHEWNRAQALSALAPHLPAQLLPEALQAAQNISDEWRHAQALIALAPLLPPHQQQALLAQALLAAQNISHEWRHAQALIALAPLLPPHQQQAVLPQALLAALTISDEWNRAQALIALAPHLPAQLLPEALQAALNISHEYWRADALIALAPLLPPHQQQALLAQVLQATLTISDEWNRAQALIALAPHLPAQLLPEALQAAQNISQEWSRAQTLIALAPFLPPHQQQAVLPQALLAAQNISDQSSRAHALIALAPLLPLDLMPEALQAALTISREESRAHALIALAPLLPPHQQQAVLPQALLAAQNISQEWSRTHALIALAPMLTPEPSHDQLVTSTLRILASRGRSDLLSDLAALAPWLIAITQRAQQPKTLSELAIAIIDTGHCWP
jgi:hypothetical protein